MSLEQDIYQTHFIMNIVSIESNLIFYISLHKRLLVPPPQPPLKISPKTAKVLSKKNSKHVSPFSTKIFYAFFRKQVFKACSNFFKTCNGYQ